MSILWRLNVMIAGLVLALLASFTMTLLIEAGPRIRSENSSMTLLAREFFLKSLDTLAHAPDPGRGLEELIERLQGVRHISIRFVRPEAPDDAGGISEAAANANGHQTEKPSKDQEIVHIPVILSGRSYGMLMIAPRPSDELDEIHEATRSVTLTSLGVSVLAFFAAGAATRRTLRPIGDLEAALGRLQEGDYDVGVATSGPPEIANIARRLNALASMLCKAQQENRQLAQKLIEAQDHERREIARELHDELGPVLFGVRATGTSLKTESEKPTADRQRIGRLAGTMLEQIEGLQATNKRVLRRLAPIGFDELGVRAAIEGLMALWRSQNPSITMNLNAPAADIDSLDRTAALTVYRMVQEAITNAVKHGRPSQIDVDIACSSAPDGTAPGTLMVSVTDNGRGLADDAKPGLGLTGMRERIEALGGSLQVRPTAGTGVRVTMCLRRQAVSSEVAFAPN